MDFEGEKTREAAGPTAEELRSEVKENAGEILRAYEKNVAPLLEKKGLQHGAPDPEGYMHHAQQMLRILKAIQDPQIDPYKWPEHFELPKDIPVVFRNSEGDVTQRELSVRDYDSPKKLTERLREILTVGGLL